MREREKFLVKQKLSDLSISLKLQQVLSDNLLMAFDANSLYPLAMSHLDSICPKLETDFVYTNGMNEEVVDNINRTYGIKFTEL